MDLTNLTVLPRPMSTAYRCTSTVCGSEAKMKLTHSRNLNTAIQILYDFLHYGLLVVRNDFKLL